MSYFNLAPMFYRYVGILMFFNFQALEWIKLQRKRLNSTQPTSLSTRVVEIFLQAHILTFNENRLFRMLHDKNAQKNSSWYCFKDQNWKMKKWFWSARLLFMQYVFFYWFSWIHTFFKPVRQYWPVTTCFLIKYMQHVWIVET